MCYIAFISYSLHCAGAILIKIVLQEYAIIKLKIGHAILASLSPTILDNSCA